MRTIQVKGIEILDNEKVPAGEIHLLCPMENGGKVRYMFNLLDHRMTQPGSEQCFLNDIEDQLKEFRVEMLAAVQTEKMDRILKAIDDFKRGKDPRTVAP